MPKIKLNQQQFDELIWFKDPGHAWLRVRLSLLEPIKNSITAYSYMDFEYAYLEEDYDAGQFFSALDKEYKNIFKNIPSRYIDNNIFIRELPHYEGV